MKKRFAEIPHNPDKGQFGDCFRACIASITEYPLSDVPNFCDPDAGDWPDNLHVWLGERGMGYFEIGLCPPDGNRGTLRWILSVMKERAPGVYYILSGQSKGFPELNHAVVCLGDRLVHNPSSTAEGEFGIGGPCPESQAFLVGVITARCTVHKRRTKASRHDQPEKDTQEQT